MLNCKYSCVVPRTPSPTMCAEKLAIVLASRRSFHGDAYHHGLAVAIAPHGVGAMLPFTRNTSPRQSIASPLTSRVFVLKMTCFGRINPSFALLRYYANSPTKQLHGAEFFESYFALSLNSQRNAAELSAELVSLK